MADSTGAGSGSSVLLILTYLYPQVTSLTCALRILSGQPSAVLSSDARSYQDTCTRTLVACDRKGRLEDFSGLCRGRETRQKLPGRNSSTAVLESVLIAVKKVSSCLGDR